MSFTVRKLTPHIGAEIVGLDISQPLDAATISAVRAAWLDNCMLIFRGQNLDPDQQRRFVGYFGEMGKRGAALPSNRPRPVGPDYNSDAMLVSNIREGGKPIGVLPDGEMWFHHDMSYSAAPNRASFLYSIEIPSHGGDTMFASMYAAYESLPPRLKERIEGRRVLQAFDEVQDSRLDLTQVPLADVKHQWQPIVIAHPETGRRALYVSRLMSHEIEGLSQDEGHALLEELYAYTEAESIRYTHKWRVGDLLMWDNLNSIHARTDFPREERRLMRRFSIAGNSVLPAWSANAAK
jgi:taurine dioxygenase